MIARLSTLCTLLLVLVLAIGTAAAADPVPHDKSYWQAVLRDYAVPPGEKPLALAQELSALLGSPDPELRDRIAYSILSVWLSGDVPWTDAELVTLLDEWQANLRVGTQPGSDAVLKRSFSALCLAVLAERDLKTPFLGPERYRSLLNAALAYLSSEHDLRGYDERKGWVHATAHTADLLAALARHPALQPAEQNQLLAAIARRLSTAPEVFTQGEQDRLAQAVTALLLRPDLDATAFDAWLTALRATTRQSARTRPLTSAALAVVQNNTYFLQALYARLSMQTLEGRAATSGAKVLDALRGR